LKTKGSKNHGGSFVKGVVCPVKNSGEDLIYNLINTFLLFLTGCKLYPPGIAVEATDF